MTFSIYTATVPVFSRALNSLSNILTKAEAWAVERKIEPVVLMQARLAADMAALPFQIQSATDHSKFAVSRLAGRTPPAWADDETTFAELQARIAKAKEYLGTVSESDLAGSEDRELVLKVRGADTTVRGADYLLTRALPNFWFHTTTAYAILRHNGVPIGKGDFLA